MNRLKPFVLPAALLLGLLFHDVCGMLSPVVPWLIFSILLLTFSSVDLRRLRPGRISLLTGIAQIMLALALYWGAISLTGNAIFAQGMMIGALCPVASSVSVVACMIGAKRENTVSYTIIGNLLIVCAAPLFFLMAGSDRDAGGILDSLSEMFSRIAAVIGLPCFVALALQMWARPVSGFLKSIAPLSFYLWAAALLLTLGQTIDFIYDDGEGELTLILSLAAGSAFVCALQFACGRLIGIRCGDTVGGQQLLGQKNTAMGIWMVNTYLNPLASTFLAFYSVWQNVFNSWQIWRSGRGKAKD